MDNLLGLIAIAIIYLCIVLRSDKKRRAGRDGNGKQAAPRRTKGRSREKHKALSYFVMAYALLFSVIVCCFILFVH